MKPNQLSDCLTPQELIALAETYGGMRLPIPQKAKDDHPLVMAIGRAGFEKLSEIYGYDTIRVPLCISLRINHYRARGMSNPQIAQRLTMTEPGVNKAIKIMRDSGELLPKPPRTRNNVRNVQDINRKSHCPCCAHYSPDRPSLPSLEEE